MAAMAAVHDLGHGEQDFQEDHHGTLEFQELRSILNDPVNHFMTSTVTFDPQEELLWVGSQSGQVTSYFGPELHKYTAFQGHHTEIRQIVPDAYGVLSLTANQIRYTTRQGLKIFLAEEESMQDMQCMLHQDSTYVLLAGHQDNFYELDTTTGDVYPREAQLEIDPSVVMMKHSDHNLLCGDSQGKITIRDPDSLEALHVLEPHSGTLSDFDISENLLVTCGFSTRFGHLSVDNFMMIYDLRTMRAFSPLQVPIEPFFVKFMPTYTTRCAVVSQIGQFTLCQPESLVVDHVIYQPSTHGATIMDFDISTSYQALVFGDAAGVVHLWADRGQEELMFNPYSEPTMLASEVHHHPALAIDDWSVPLSSFVMPECHEPLLSDWPENLTRKVYRKAPEIDPDILKNMTIRQFVGYAPNPKKGRRNQTPYSSNTKSQSTRTGGGNHEKSPMSRDPTGSLVPKMYRKVEIKYSKYGVEDFDFRHYNHTNFAGLEIHIPNAYCNSMLQVFFFMEPLRAGLQNHICQKEFCLACELGFLFYMLDTTDGQTCQASNFLRAFRTLREASALGLILSDADESTGQQNLSRRIQSWNRFVLQQLHQDTQTTTEKDENTSKGAENESIIKSLFGSDMEISSKCRCGSEITRQTTSFLFDLQYPEKTSTDKEYCKQSFISLLKSSISRQQTMHAWCDECNKYQSTAQTRKLKTLPDVFNINCQIDQEREYDFWRKQLEEEELFKEKHGHKLTHYSPPKLCRNGKLCNRPGCRFYHGRDGEYAAPSTPTDTDSPFVKHFKQWIPQTFKAYLDEETEELLIEENTSKSFSFKEGDTTTLYKLVSSVYNIRDPKVGCNLVAHIDVGESYHERKERTKRQQLYVFNDFAITAATEHEACDVNLDWKVPCVLVYARADLNSKHKPEIVPQLDPKILLTADKSLAQRQVRFSRQFTPLNSSEVPQEGDFVGIDAEFVTLNQEESEMRSDGTLSTLKPSHMSVARITVVRGWGALMGVPFIDDYISTSEQVVDYLTKFSGIKPGDLDANMSSKHLTTLKTTYQKLRYLVDSKVTFVGHGLKKDFRVINLVVPREQVIDTVELFNLPNQRYVSLKFLAWHFLKLKIQEGTHDSTEDAYTALRLFCRYQDILRDGEDEFYNELDILYETGRQYSWQIPD